MSVLKSALVTLLAAGYLQSGIAAAEAGGAAAHCRQEAADYGIEPELVAEYIAGCVESMGGAAYAASDEQVVDDGGASPEVQTSGENE